MSGDIFRSDEEVGEVLLGFESCALPPAEFSHARHLAVALALLARHGDEGAAIERVRAGLRRYLAAHGVDPRKYHETVTVFWVKRVRAFAARAAAGSGPPSSRRRKPPPSTAASRCSSSTPPAPTPSGSTSAPAGSASV